ncbi:MAG TPA: EcsC family protein [Thermoanaerobaculia bacterium]|nr:EcsC family protein [Thermoanaerobaculia bacterium]
MGRPIESVLARLPQGVNDRIQRITRKSIEKALDVALLTFRDRQPAAPRSFDRSHKVFTALSGGVGGMFGFAGLAVELPITTTAILRSIAEIARSQGEDLRSPEAKLACLQVLALGGAAAGDDVGESGYFAVRAVFTKSISELADVLAGRTAVRQTAPALVDFVSRLAARFGVRVSEKVAVQAVPLIGALGGATINVLFTDHFQDMARGHFTVRRLERTYGAETVRIEYDALAAPAAPG